MRKLTIRFSAFILFACAIWFAIAWISSRHASVEARFIGLESNGGFLNQRTLEWGSDDPHQEDVLFFGSSTCYSGIDPHALETFGLTGFNFCSSSQAISHSECFIQTALIESQPQFVVLDVYPAMWGTEAIGLECARDWIINSNLRSPIWKKTMLSMAVQTGDLFAVFSALYFNTIRPIKAAGSNPFLFKDQMGAYRGKGFVGRLFPSIDRIACETLEVKMTDYECGHIRNIQSLCSENSAELILVNPPQLCEESFDIPVCFEGISFIDGNEWPGSKTPQNFYDDHHLVEAGALDYSSWLAERIVNLQ